MRGSHQQKPSPQPLSHRERGLISLLPAGEGPGMRAKRTDETVSVSVRGNFEIAARIRLATQRGVAALMAVLFLLFMLGVVLLLAHQMAATDVYDSGAQNNIVEALFLAETGVERATSRFATVACNALGEAAIQHGRGQFTISNGLSTDFAGAALPANRCRVPVTGEILGAIRVGRRVEAIVERGSAAISASPVTAPTSGTTTLLQFSHTVTAGQTLLLVGISVDRTDTTITGVTYAGLAMTRAASAPGSGNNRPKAEIWYRLNPPVGTANVQVSLSVSDQIIAGAVSFQGVAITSPFFGFADGAAVVARDPGPAQTVASLTITPVTNGAWVFEVVAVNNNPSVLTPTAIAGQTRTLRWNPASVSGTIRGAATTIGPINPAVAVTPVWTWIGSQRWAQAAVSLRPGGPSRVVAWRELTN